MSVIVGQLHKKKIVRNMSGEIVDLLDETDGGWIIKNKQVVNQEKYDELVRKEEDRKEAAKAITKQVSNPNAPDRNIVPGKQDEMQKEIDELKAMVKKLAEK
jgi:dihydroorotate dehydrogenase